MRFVKFRALSVLMLSALSVPTTMAAEENSNLAVQESYIRLLEHPADRQLNLNYAKQAMQLKDYEAAIPPLERILMNEPLNAKICLQIGILYHLLHSDTIAREYFLEAKSTPGARPAITKEADGYLH